MSNQMPPQLLAKSIRNGLKVTLARHLSETEEAARLIFDLGKRWGKNWCRFFKIEPKDLQKKFLLNLRVAALFHDIGKANEDFYQAVTEKPIKQMLRHEHLSAAVLCLPEVHQWLSKNDDLDFEIIAAAVISHHLKASRSGDWKWCQPRSLKKVLALYLQHQEVAIILTRIAEIGSLDAPPTLDLNKWSTNEKRWIEAFQRGIKCADKLAQEIKSSPERLSLLLAVKTGVIVADAASSGLVRTGENIQDWIIENAHQRAIVAGEVTQEIINKRGEQIRKSKGEFKLQSFQERIVEQGQRVLLLAACAAGKTLAAWNWAESIVRQREKREIGKVVFLYPTRGTATEGFRDYVSWAPEADAALVHGTAKYELEAMRENPSEAMAEKSFSQLTEDQERLFALGFWSRRFFSATVDQFLGFMEHSYTGLCLLPALADSAVIIDEVHSFDRRMFDALIQFLKHFDVPVLCMTATLPKSRREELVAAGLTVYPTEELRNEFFDLAEKETRPRYLLQPVVSWNDAFNKAVKAYQNGRRVLWVVNRVDECQRIANDLEKELKTPVITYHSRFKLEDRQRCHADTIKAFQQISTSAIAVTTQVCEMSLDLDADVLITELAPISSLVQRFGRANRHLKRDYAVLHTYAPEHHLPYEKSELELAEQFIKVLGTGTVSQYEMAEKLEELSRSERKSADASASFLNSGFFAVRGSFRDTDELTQPCVLESDLDNLKEALDAKPRRPYDGLIVGVPCKHSGITKEHGIEWLPKYLLVADANYYDRSRGYKKERNK